MRDNNLQEGLVALKLDAFQSQCHKVSEGHWVRSIPSPKCLISLAF